MCLPRYPCSATIRDAYAIAIPTCIYQGHYNFLNCSKKQFETIPIPVKPPVGVEGEHGDLVLEAGEIMGVRDLKASRAKVVGVKAMLEIVGFVFGF